MPDDVRRKHSTKRLATTAATVLVIDDDPMMVESLAMLLEDHGFRVLTANNGVRGLRVFRKQRPAAVLTDIVMPEQDGIGAGTQPVRPAAAAAVELKPQSHGGALKPCWRPGQSGNPSGERGALYEGAMRLARELVPRAIERLGELIESEDERVAAVACNFDC